MDKSIVKTKSLEYTKKLVLIGMFAATIIGAKFALMALPNIEVVTLFIILFTYVFGLGIGLSATLIFCVVEMFIFPMGSWVISYFIHWPLVSIMAFLFSKIISKNRAIFPAIFAFVITLLFGVLTSFVDTLVYTTPDLYLKMFGAMYVKGIPFFLTHIVSNTLVVGFAFLPLSKMLEKLKEHFLPQKNDTETKIDNLKTDAETKINNKKTAE